MDLIRFPGWGTYVKARASRSTRKRAPRWHTAAHRIYNARDAARRLRRGMSHAAF
jgi:hypothetical protein